MLVTLLENLQQNTIEVEEEDDLKAQRKPFPPTIAENDVKEGPTRIGIPSGKLVQLRCDCCLDEGINAQTSV